MKQYFLFLVILSACHTPSKVAVKDTDFIPDFSAGPHVMVYKTKADYSTKVPVILSDDKTRITSYPDPSDLTGGDAYPSPPADDKPNKPNPPKVQTDNNNLPTPTPLNEGYLLDNRGINLNVAFLDISYQNYTKLKGAPSLKDMYSVIIDKNPLTELCDCGNRYAFKDVKEQINILIKTKKLRSVCKVLK